MFSRDPEPTGNGRSSVAKAKPFDIPKREVWEAFKKVKANQGAAGVDGQTIAEFEADLSNNLYRLWNRMSSGSYFPPPVLAVEIPKPQGGGMRVLGVPTVADRVAQTVVARRLEEKVEPIFHKNSYGYRPGRSALDAVAACRKRCWKKDWVIDLDVAKFFDSVPWGLMVKAAQAKLATAASDHLKAKLVTGKFFVERMLPETALHLARIQAGAATVMELPADAF